MIEDRHVGKFKIGLDVIDDSPEVVLQIMGQTIIIRAECLLAEKSIEYFAICQDFEEIDTGEVAPEYDVMFDSETGQVTWSKVA